MVVGKVATRQITLYKKTSSAYQHLNIYTTSRHHQHINTLTYTPQTGSSKALVLMPTEA
ncbi:MAG: hypothetical protein IJ421_00790 [Prevotella sp.]|nr:hypothetical protein [Prevotella sp.]